MEITDIKNAVADRANGYTDLITGSLRSIAESLNGRARGYAEEAAEAVPEPPGMSRGTNYTRMGVWFGLGIALAGAAVYAWQEYRRMNAGTTSGPIALLEAPKRSRKSASAASTSTRPKARTAGSSAGAGTAKRSRPAGSTVSKPAAKRKPKASS